MKYRFFYTILFILFLCTACATSPTGRSQLQFFSPQKLSEMGRMSYRQLKKDEKVIRGQEVNSYVNCVVRSIDSALPASAGSKQWQITVFDNDEAVNAFALPGGYIGVYTGLLKIIDNQDQLAAVIGHEIAHVTAGHPNARLSSQYATQAGLQAVNAFLEGQVGGSTRTIMALLGLGSQVGILLPFSRSQEQEADILGLQYMARAGFDPGQSIQLWKNMSRAGGEKPPEFLSTHPSDYSRIQTLQAHMPEAMELYRRARQQNRIPQCR